MRGIEVQILAALLSYGSGDALRALTCEQCTIDASFDTQVHAEVSLSYPRLLSTGLLAHCANEAIRQEAHKRYAVFRREAEVLQAPYEEDENEWTLRYDVHSVGFHPHLISFYGSEYQYCGGAHGSVRYITKTFVQDGDTAHELSLDDLFLPGGREELFRYCEHHFKTHRSGYYSDDDPSWIGFGPEHLDAFILTEKGLLLIFQNYVVSGYEDEPITLLVPYDKLTAVIYPRNFESGLL